MTYKPDKMDNATIVDAAAAWHIATNHYGLVDVDGVTEYCGVREKAIKLIDCLVDRGILELKRMFGVSTFGDFGMKTSRMRYALTNEGRFLAASYGELRS
ncbi:MAG TPA: hypothetical protein VJH04_00265 [archaeon]|nr:hypothetical protein [archaeon]